MTLDAAQIQEVLRELEPLAGAKIQRVDVVAERELVVEVRCPGRTVRLLLSARPGLGRVHVVEQRPPRTAPGGALQITLRHRLVGRTLHALEAEQRTVLLDLGDGRLAVRLDGGKDALRFLPPSGRPPPELSGVVQLPERFEASARVEARYAARLPKETDRALRTLLQRTLGARRRKLERLAAKVRGDHGRLVAMRAEGAHGELLKSELHRVPRGATSIRVTDWSTGEPVEVPLDPALSAKENMERCFRRAKKATRGLPLVEARLEKLDRELARIAAEVAAIEAASGEALLAMAEAQGGGVHGHDPERGSAAPSEAKATKPRPIDQWSRRFVALDGSEIRVGKGAKENDRLTFSGAKGDDIWMHARGTPGAHVILRNERGKSPQSEALLDAAHLAAHFSDARREGKVEIVWTEARNVKKTKGDPPGRVNVAKGRTLLVSIEETRLDRLLGRTGP